MRSVFQAPRGHQLHADADAEKGPPFANNRLGQGVEHAVERQQSTAAVSEGADTRQHDPVGV